MNRDFLRLYEDELRHIREVASEFAVDHDDIAGHLSMNTDNALLRADPFVERLLEGFAFLTARVRLKLEAEYPRFTQGILETVYPDHVAPWPAAAIVQFRPNVHGAAPPGGTPVPAGTLLNATTPGGVECTFRTAHPLSLYPLKVSAAEYAPLDSQGWPRDETDDRAWPPELARLGWLPAGATVFRLRLETDGKEGTRSKLADWQCEALTFHLNGENDPQLAANVLETLLLRTRGIFLVAPEDDDRKSRVWALGREKLRHAGFDAREAMLPGNPRGFEGHRILREHFLLPRRNHFIEVSGLEEAFAGAPGRRLDLLFVLDAAKPPPSQKLPASLVRLFCTPVTNLFEAETNRIPVTRSMSEYPVVVDGGRSLNHEIFSVSRVTGFRSSSSERHPFHPFYLRPASEAGLAGFYTTYREQRHLSEREKQAERSHEQFNRQSTFSSRDQYRGSEVYLTIVNADSLPVSPAVEELQARVWCTNRHLTLDLQTGVAGTPFSIKNLAGAVSIQTLGKITPPYPSSAEGRTAWRAINQLSLNYLSLVDDTRGPGKSGAEALRSLLRLHVPGDPSQPDAGSSTARTLIEQIRHVSSAPELVRDPEGGPVTFIRGLGIELTMAGAGLASGDAFMLASVLEEFFARYVSTNHFTRLTLQLPEQGGTARWPARVGRIPVC